MSRFRAPICVLRTSGTSHLTHIGAQRSAAIRCGRTARDSQRGSPPGASDTPAGVQSWLGWCAERGYEGPTVPAWAKRLAVPDSEPAARSRMAIDRLIARREVHLRERAARDPPHSGLLLGRTGQARPAVGDLPPHPRRHLLPRLLLRRRRPVVGRQPPPQRHRQQPGRAEVNPRGPARRRPDLHHSGQPLRPHRRGHPPLGEEEQGRAVLHPDLRLLDQPDRGTLRPTAAAHPDQLEPPQPSHADPSPAPLPALAQRQRPPPRGTRRPAQGTRPHPQRQGRCSGTSRHGRRSGRRYEPPAHRSRPGPGAPPIPSPRVEQRQPSVSRHRYGCPPGERTPARPRRKRWPRRRRQQSSSSRAPGQRSTDRAACTSTQSRRERRLRPATEPSSMFSQR